MIDQGYFQMCNLLKVVNSIKQNLDYSSHLILLFILLEISHNTDCRKGRKEQFKNIESIEYVI